MKIHDVDMRDGKHLGLIDAAEFGGEYNQWVEISADDYADFYLPTARKLQALDFVPHFLSVSYASGENPLPILRKIFNCIAHDNESIMVTYDKFEHAGYVNDDYKAGWTIKGATIVAHVQQKNK